MVPPSRTFHLQPTPFNPTLPDAPQLNHTTIIPPQKEYSEKDIMTLLPDKRMTLDIMVITKLLSSRGTNSLGNFEMQYLYDPVGVAAAEE